MSAMAKAQKAKAETFVASAEKILAKKSWFSSSRDKNQEEAAEVLLQAANAYKVGGLNAEAGATYMRVGKLYQEMTTGDSNTNDAAKAYTQAGSCFKKCNAVDAVQAYEAAITLLTDAGRLTQAAKLCKECAELFETADEMAAAADSMSTIVNAIQFYEQASELYDMEDSKSSANTCRAKVAELSSAALDPPDLLKASQIYQRLGLACLDSNLLKFNAKGYFLQAILCQLANGDAVGAEQALSRYEGVDYTFSESREGKLARQLVDCVDRFDAESMATACFEYDRISKLDPWKTSMLVKVKRSIQEDGGTGGGGGDDEDDVDLT